MDTHLIEPELQRLFDGYNRHYWRGKLPWYKVIASYRYHGGYCDKRNRKIFLNLATLGQPAEMRATLLHEMAHAAAKGDCHGRTWQAEMKRLYKLGAPIAMEDLDPATRHDSKQILMDFEDAGLEAPPNSSWRQVRRILGYELMLVDNRGRAVNRRVVRLLEKARRRFNKGRRRHSAHTMEEMQRGDGAVNP